MTNRTNAQNWIANVAQRLDDFTRAMNRRPYHSAICGCCRRTHDWRASCRIPDAPYYVISVDTFLSGWGKARGMVNVCVVPCATWREAEQVYRYVKGRSDQKSVRIVAHKPRPRGRKLSLVMPWRYHALDRDEPR